MKHRRSVDLSSPPAPAAVPTARGARAPSAPSQRAHGAALAAEPATVSIPLTALRGRGTAWSIAHRFSTTSSEPVDDGWGDPAQQAQEQMLGPRTEVIEQQVGTILSPNESPDITFDLSINPYRGCEHGCIYCFARPTHSYLNLSPGLDFETRIIAKMNAAERLREALSRPAYRPKLLNLGSATDAYQPVERRLGITRSVIQVLGEFQHPFSLVTKSAGVERDLDLLVPMARAGAVAVYISLTTLDPALARILEPRAAAPHRRLRAIQTLTRAGVPVGVSISPMIPFINEPELERLLESAAEAGARQAFMTVLRLPWEVNPLFQNWLDAHFPQRAQRVMARVREIHGGKDYDPRFDRRQRGRGVWAELLNQRFDKACARYGLLQERVPLDLSRFTRPEPPPTQPRQRSLF